MRLSFAVAACLPFANVFAIPTNWNKQPAVARSYLLQNASVALQPLLSENARVILPTSDQWAELQLRGSSPRIQPNYNMVVEPATEGDVQKTVQIASRFGIPFLAVSGAHGWTTTLNNMHGGIQINMRGLNSTILAEDGQTATVGGGIIQWEVTEALYAQNKMAVTGLCECVSVIGPLMAGGHSMLQAQYGLAVDNLVSARVVLSDGSAVTASSTENSDLFWALRGAGHNFGIVTSMQLKVHDVKSSWTIYTFIYPSAKLESVLEMVNQVDGSPTRPDNLVIYAVITRMPNVDTQNPLIAYTVSYEGTEAEAAPYFAHFEAAGPVNVLKNTDVNYVELYIVTRNDRNSPACAENRNNMGSGTSLPAFNTTSTRAAFTIFSNLTADPRFAQSVLLLESYGMRGVRDADASATSLSAEEREYPVVANPSIFWDGDASKDTEDAAVYTEQIRQALFDGLPEGAKKHVYVNYATGTESFDQLYGYEKAKVKRLRALKRKLDPENKFGYYNPIIRR